MRPYALTFSTLLLLVYISGKCDYDNFYTDPPSSAGKMQNFVKNISSFAKSKKPSFIIITQNGPELAFKNANSQGNFNHSYLNAIDAIAVEELFYNGTFAPDSFRINLLQQLRAKKPIMTAEFVSNATDIQDAIEKCHQNQFLCYLRTADNYHYQMIPEQIENENDQNIEKIDQVKNYLYLINSCGFTNKQQFLQKIAETNFDMVTIDLSFSNNETFTAADLASLKQKANGGKRLVIAYLNIGAAETWRYYWQPDWQLGNPSWIAKPYKDYENEYWVNFWESEWQQIIYGHPTSYVQRIINAGFDGVFLDNVEAYYFLYHDE